MRQRSKTADGKTSTYEDESCQETRLISNAIKFEEGNLEQHQAWVRGWEIVAYNEHRRSFIAQGSRRDEHLAAAVLAQVNAEKARSEVDSTEQHLRHLKREYVRKGKLRRYEECLYQTILGKRKSDADGRHGETKRQRKFCSQAREEVLEQRMIGEKLASYLLEPDEEVDSPSGSEVSTSPTEPRTASRTACAASQRLQGLGHPRHSITPYNGRDGSSNRASGLRGITSATVGAPSAASAQPAALKGFQTNGWTSVNAPTPPKQQPRPPKKPRATTGGLHLPKTDAPPPLQASPKTESQPPSPRPSRPRGTSLNRTSQPPPSPTLQPSPTPPLQRPRQTSPRPAITPAEGRRRIILGPPSPVHGLLNPSPHPPAALAGAPPQSSQTPAHAQRLTSSQAGPNNKRKRDKDGVVADTAAKSTSQAGPSSKRVREQPAPAAAPTPVSTNAAASVVAPPAPANVNASPAPKYVRGGVKSSFLEEAEALASHVAPNGKTRKSGRVSKKRQG